MVAVKIILNYVKMILFLFEKRGAILEDLEHAFPESSKATLYQVLERWARTGFIHKTIDEVGYRKYVRYLPTEKTDEFLREIRESLQDM